MLLRVQLLCKSDPTRMKTVLDDISTHHHLAFTQQQGNFTTAGGRAVALDRSHLQEAEALLARCEVPASTLPCIGGDDAALPQLPPLQGGEQPSIQAPGRHDLLEMLNPPDQEDHVNGGPVTRGECAGKVPSTSQTASLCGEADHDGVAAVSSQEMKQSMPRLMTAGGRAVAVDRSHLQEAEALLARCEVPAGTLPCIGGDDAAVPQLPPLQGGEQPSIQAPGRHDLLEMLNPPDQEDHVNGGPVTHGECAGKVPSTSQTASLCGEADHDGVAAVSSQEMKQSMPRLMTAGGRAVAVDRSHLQEAEALLARCEVPAGTLPCIGGDDAAAPQLPPLQGGEQPSIQAPVTHVVCAGRVPSTSQTASLCGEADHDGVAAVSSQEMKQSMPRLMTAGGRAVAVDRSHLQEAEALLARCEVPASTLPCIGGDDAAVPQLPPLQGGEQPSIQAPGRHDVLEMLNPPDQEDHVNGGPVRHGERAGKVPSTSQTASLCGEADHDGVAAVSSQEMKQSMPRLMTAGGRAVAVDRSHLQEAEALLARCEVPAGTLPCIGGDDAAVPQLPPLQGGEQPSIQAPDRHDLLEMLNPPDQEDHVNGGPVTHGERAGKVPSTSQTASLCGEADHDGVAAVSSQEMKQSMPRLMTAGGRAVAVDRSHLQEAEALLARCEVPASTLPCIGGDDAAVPQLPPLQGGEQPSIQAPGRHDLLEMLNPPDQEDHVNGGPVTHGECAGKVPSTSQTASLCGEADHDGVAAVSSQEMKQSMPRLMTAGGRAVAVDRSHLQEAEALLARCEVPAGTLPCIGGDDAAAPQLPPLQGGEQPSIQAPVTHVVCAGRVPSTSQTASLCGEADHDGVAAVSSQEMKQSMPRLMTAGGRAVAVDRSHLQEAEALLARCEVPAGTLPCIGGDDAAVPQLPPLQGGEQPSIQAPGRHDLLEMFNAPDHEGQDERGRVKQLASVLSSGHADDHSVNQDHSRQGRIDVQRDLDACVQGGMQMVFEDGAYQNSRCECISRKRASSIPLGNFYGSRQAVHPGHTFLLGSMLTSVPPEDLEEAWPSTDASLREWITTKASAGTAEALMQQWRRHCAIISPRHDDKWFYTQLAQMALLSAQSAMCTTSSSEFACERVAERVARRARAELSGRRSAIFQISTGLAPADQHLVLMCTAPWLTWLTWLVKPPEALCMCVLQTTLASNS